jgi:hypothetical protein
MPRHPDPSLEQQISQARDRAKLEGESDGITLGRIQERNLIVRWLRQQSSMGAWRLAKLIEHGNHKEDT